MFAGSWGSFERDLAAWVRRFSRPNLQFCAGWKAIPGFPSDGFRADALLTDSRKLLAVEVEVRQTHPDTNVGKYWLLSRHHRYESVVLFHVYTPAYNSYGWRMELGKFYAEKMSAELPFQYFLLDRRRDTDVASTLLEVQSSIEPHLRRLFGGKSNAA
jgi:hypothetical protein